MVEFYGDKIMEHPVGTGPFRLAEWRRSSRIVLESNPGYREVLLRRGGAAPTTRSRRRRRSGSTGRKLPMVDRVEICVIEEPQPRWLAFLNREMDIIEQVPEDFADIAIPNNKLAPNLAKRGIYDGALPAQRRVDVVLRDGKPGGRRLHARQGGAAPRDRAGRQRRRGDPRRAHAARRSRRSRSSAPGLWGYDPAFKQRDERASTAPGRKALLDLYGYVDRDGDGWREQPDGSPLVLEYATQPDDLSRQLIDAVEEEHGCDRHPHRLQDRASGPRT